MNPLEEPALKEYLRKLVTDEGLKVIEAIPPDGEITDEKLAEVSGINLYVVRKTLYNLYEKHVTEYRRERNDENGWLTYFWKLNFKDMDITIRSEMEKLSRNLKQRLNFELNNTFYECDKDKKRFLFDSATKNGFKCSICGSKLRAVDNSELIQAIERRIELLRGSL
jgi:transcription initiation factor TFIIE subunit alpha